MKKFKLKRGSIDSVYLRTALLATTAVVLSYMIGSATTFIAADIAAIWALVSVRATFHTAVRETVIQIVSTIIGGIVGYLAIQTYGFNIFLLSGLVLFSFAVGFLLKMGLEGSVIMGFTIIAVTSNAFSFESTEARISGVILGTLVATFFSLFVSRGTPQSRIRKDLDLLIQRKKKVLNQLSELVAEGNIEQAKVFELSIASKILLEDFTNLLSKADDLVEGSKWSPLTKREEAISLREEVVSFRDDTLIVVDMVESVEALRTNLPKSFAEKARISIENAANVIFNGAALDTEVIVLPKFEESTGLTPAQILLANDLIASAEKLRKRKKRKNGKQVD